MTFFDIERICEEDSIDSIFIELLSQKEILIKEYTYKYNREIDFHPIWSEKILYNSPSDKFNRFKMNIIKLIDSKITKFSNADFFVMEGRNTIYLRDVKSVIIFGSINVVELISIVKRHYFDGCKFLLFPYNNNFGQKAHFYEICFSGLAFNTLQLKQIEKSKEVLGVLDSIFKIDKGRIKNVKR